MENEAKSGCCKDVVCSRGHGHSGCGGGGALYGLGVIGSLFYFLQGAGSAGAVLLGIGKAIFWPSLVVFRVLTYLKI